MGDDAIVPSPLGIYKMGDDTGGGPIMISGLGEDGDKVYKSSEVGVGT